MTRSGGNNESRRLNAMLTQYEQLRNEVIQSIRFQNRIVLGEAIVVALISGLQIATLFRSALKSSLAPIIQLAAFVLPPIIIVSTALWAAEQSRMMRIGNYLSLLENKVNEDLNAVCLSWENWLRSGSVSFVGNIHHAAKIVGYVGFFCLLGILGLLLYVKNLLMEGPLDVLAAFELAFFVMYVLLFVFVLLLTIPIIDYRQDTILSGLASKLPSGQQWSPAEFSNDFTQWGDNHREYAHWEDLYKQQVLHQQGVEEYRLHSEGDVQSQLRHILSNDRTRRGS